MLRIVLSLLLAGLAVSAGTAHATPYDVYGAGARGAAMSAQTAVASGPEALHYNPSHLATAPLGLTVGMLATFGNAQILLKERPAGYDVPNIGPPARSPGEEFTLRERSDTELTRPLVGLTIGAVAPLIFDGLRAGLLIFLPLPTPVTLETYFADERERYFSNRLRFERIGPKVHQLDLEFGVAYEVLEWLSVGIGATYLPGFAVDTGVYLPDATDQETADINATVTTENAFGLLAGATFRLPADVRVGVSFRDSTALKLEGGNAVQLNGVTEEDPIEQVADWTPIFSPARIALGVGWGVGRWLLSADARYTLWSRYNDSHARETSFYDVVSAALGAEFRATDNTALRGGLGFEPTPVPDQTGRTNFVDNDRLSFSLGAGHQFTVGESEFDVSWAIRVHALLRRETVKEVRDDYPTCGEGVTALCDEIPDDLEDPETGRPFPEAHGLQTGNPGFPGWVSGGWHGSIGAELRY